MIRANGWQHLFFFADGFRVEHRPPILYTWTFVARLMRLWFPLRLGLKKEETWSSLVEVGTCKVWYIPFRGFKKRISAKQMVSGLLGSRDVVFKAYVAEPCFSGSSKWAVGKTWLLELCRGNDIVEIVKSPALGIPLWDWTDLKSRRFFMANVSWSILSSCFNLLFRG